MITHPEDQNFPSQITIVGNAHLLCATTTTFWRDSFNIFQSFQPLVIISIHLTPGLISVFTVCTVLLRVKKKVISFSDNTAKHIITLK